MKSAPSSVTFGALAVSSVAAYRGIPLQPAFPNEPRSDSALQAAPECAKSCVTSSNCSSLGSDLDRCVLDQCEDDEFDGLAYAYSACANLLENEIISSIVDAATPISTESSTSLTTPSTTATAASTPADFIRRGNKWPFHDFWTFTETKPTPYWPTWGPNRYYGPAKATKNETVIITISTDGWPPAPVPTVLRREANETVISTSLAVSFTATPGGTVTSVVPSPTTTTNTVTSVSTTTDTETSPGKTSANVASSTQGSSRIGSTLQSPGTTTTVPQYTPVLATSLSYMGQSIVTDPEKISGLKSVSRWGSSASNSVTKNADSALISASISVISQSRKAMVSIASQSAANALSALSGASPTFDGTLLNMGTLVTTACIVTGMAMGFGLMLSV